MSPFACDTDHDRHGIVTHSAGSLPPNHYLPVPSITSSGIARDGAPMRALGRRW